MANRSSQTQSRNNNQTKTAQGSDSSESSSVKEALDEIMDIEGAVGAAIMDYENGMTLGTIGGRNLDMELAGAGTTEVVRSERSIIHDLGLQEGVQDILITLSSQHHLVRMCQRHEDVFIYLVIDRDKGNLGLARRAIDDVDQRLELK
jgi:hypothetical protein